MSAQRSNVQTLEQSHGDQPSSNFWVLSLPPGLSLLPILAIPIYASSEPHFHKHRRSIVNVVLPFHLGAATHYYLLAHATANDFLILPQPSRQCTSSFVSHIPARSSAQALYSSVHQHHSRPAHRKAHIARSPATQRQLRSAPSLVVSSSKILARRGSPTNFKPSCFADFDQQSQ